MLVTILSNTLLYLCIIQFPKIHHYIRTGRNENVLLHLDPYNALLSPYEARPSVTNLFIFLPVKFNAVM